MEDELDDASGNPCAAVSRRLISTGCAAAMDRQEPAADRDAGAFLVLALFASPPLWWATQLIGLPDIGDPFDAEKFRASPVPDDRNAFVLYSRAAALLNRAAEYPGAGGQQGRLARSLAGGHHRRSAGGPRITARHWRSTAKVPSGLTRLTRPSVLIARTSRQSEAFGLCACWPCSRLRGWRKLVTWPGHGAGTRPSCAPIHHVGMHGGGRQAQRYPALAQRASQSVDDVGRRPADDARAASPGLDDVVACEAHGSLGTSIRSRPDILTVIKLLDSSTEPGPQRRRSCGSASSGIRTTSSSPEQIQALWDALAILAPRARTKPAVDPASDRQLAGVSRAA